MADFEIKDKPEQTTPVGTDKILMQDVSNVTKYVLGSTLIQGSDLLKINSPSYATLQELFSALGSPGIIDGGAITNNGDGTVDVAAGNARIKSSDSDVGDIYTALWVTKTALALTDNSINYIYVTYVNTTTNLTVTANASQPTDFNRNVVLGTVYRSGNEIHITGSYKHNIANADMNMIRRLHETLPFSRVDGGALTATGTRRIAVSAGSWWEGLFKFSTVAQDSNGSDPNNHTFEYFFYNGSSWITHEETIDAAVMTTGAGLDDLSSGGTFVGSHTIKIAVEVTATGTPDTYKWGIYEDGSLVTETTGVAMVGGAVNLVDGITITFAATTGHTLGDIWEFDALLSTTIDNTQYNNTASGLATLTNNKYGVHWVYIDVHGHVAVLFGQGDYSLSEAEDAGPPTTTPNEFLRHTRLIGRVIIKKSDSTFTLIENNYADEFQASLPVDLSGYLQLVGGTLTGPVVYDTDVGITAFATGGQGSATALTAQANVIATCATGGDSVKLPTAIVGTRVLIMNNGANSCDVFPLSGDNLGAGVDTAVALAASNNIEYFAIDTTNWETI